MRVRKTDGNHKAIREAFRKRGFSWADTHTIGGGYPDGVVGAYGLCMLIEVKDGSLAPSKRKLTPDEETFFKNWTGGIRIVETEQDVDLVCDMLTTWHRYILEGIAREMNGA